MRTGAVELLLSQCPLNGGLCRGLLRRCWFAPRLLVHFLLIHRQQQITPRWIGQSSSVGSLRIPPRSMRPSRRSRSEEVPGLWVGHITWSFILCGSPPLVRQTEDRVRYPTLAGVRDSGARHFWVVSPIFATSCAASALGPSSQTGETRTPPGSLEAVMAVILPAWAPTVDGT